MDTVERPAPQEANPELLELAERMARGEQPGGAPGDGGGADPGAGGARRAPGAEESVYGLTRGLVDGVCAMVSRRWPAAIYSEDEKQMMAGLLVPVALKRIGDPWFLKYEAEFRALGFAVYMGYTGQARVQKARAAEPAPASSWDGSTLRP